jgi:hypothetical protein
MTILNEADPVFAIGCGKKVRKVAVPRARFIAVSPVPKLPGSRTARGSVVS